MRDGTVRHVFPSLPAPLPRAEGSKAGTAAALNAPQFATTGARTTLTRVKQPAITRGHPVCRCPLHTTGPGAAIERFTISLDDALAQEFDRLIAERGYDNRSEAVRDLLRSHLDRQREARDADGPCVGNLSYVYNHHERELAERLMAIQHAQHDLVVSTMHAHLDHEYCIETVILKGPARAVRQFANTIAAERGVRHGSLNLVLVEEGHAHSHGDGPAHVHVRPQR